MAANTWNVPDPNGILAEGSPTRRKIKAYAAAHGIDLAEAIAQIVAFVIPDNPIP